MHSVPPTLSPNAATGRTGGGHGDRAPGATTAPPAPIAAPAAEPAHRRAARYAWAMLLARTYEVLPLGCPLCGAGMRIIAFVTVAAHPGATPGRRVPAHASLPARRHPGGRAGPEAPRQACGAARCHRKWTLDSTDRLLHIQACAVASPVRRIAPMNITSPAQPCPICGGEAAAFDVDPDWIETRPRGNARHLVPSA